MRLRVEGRVGVFHEQSKYHPLYYNIICVSVGALRAAAALEGSTLLMGRNPAMLDVSEITKAGVKHRMSEMRWDRIYLLTMHNISLCCEVCILSNL